MIDITVDNNMVTVEDKTYGNFNDRNELVGLITNIIEKAKYSGETVSLHVLRFSSEDKKIMKFFVKEWP